MRKFLLGVAVLMWTVSAGVMVQTTFDVLTHSDSDVILGQLAWALVLIGTGIVFAALSGGES